tara:strand:+ start:198 stop:350 length:153 start_codon:yes stop_codon:yes gene_type:complete
MDITTIFDQLSESIADVIENVNEPSEELLKQLEVKQEELASIIYQLTNKQ